MKESEPCGCGKSDMRIISLWLVAVFITFWLIALSWLAVILYGEIKKMDVSIKSGKQIVPHLCTSPLFAITSVDKSDNIRRYKCFEPLLFWN